MGPGAYPGIFRKDVGMNDLMAILDAEIKSASSRAQKLAEIKAELVSILAANGKPPMVSVGTRPVNRNNLVTVDTITTIPYIREMILAIDMINRTENRPATAEEVCNLIGEAVGSKHFSALYSLTQRGFLLRHGSRGGGYVRGGSRFGRGYTINRDKVRV